MTYKGPNCPICNKERTYKTYQGLRNAEDKPCISCSNSLKAGGKGDVNKRGCFECGNQEIHFNNNCKNCHQKKSRLYYKNKYRWAKYGLDSPIEMNQCEICDSTEDLVIDHCHNTSKVRGVLCRTCNLGIGSLKENKEIIRKALMYAERTFNES